MCDTTLMRFQIFFRFFIFIFIYFHFASFSFQFLSRPWAAILLDPLCINLSFFSNYSEHCSIFFQS
jgi:hypothetical protein